MSEFYENDITIYQWLDFFASRSNHWIFKYWRRDRENFFERFMILGDCEIFIICDKRTKSVYEFIKPKIVQLTLENL